MTVNAVRRKLRSIRHIRKEIEILGYQIEELRTKAEGAGGGCGEFHPKGGITDSKIEVCVMKIMELEERMAKKKEELIAEEIRAEDLLNVLTDNESCYRSVLRCIYILCRTQEQTAEILCYSERHVQRLERTGIYKIAKRCRVLS